MVLITQTIAAVVLAAGAADAEKLAGPLQREFDGPAGVAALFRVLEAFDYDGDGRVDAADETRRNALWDALLGELGLDVLDPDSPIIEADYRFVRTVRNTLDDASAAAQVANYFANRVPMDTTAPVVTLAGDPIVRLTVGDAFVDPGATATDDRDGDVSASIVVDSNVDTSAAGRYGVKYTARDAAGNEGAETRVVLVFDPIVLRNREPEPTP